jgi:seryl-tRNA synthetase
MINIKDLVANKDKYLTGFQNKGMDLANEVEKVIELQNELTPLLQQESDVRAELNNVSKQIGQDPKNNELKQEAGKLSSEAKAISAKIKELQEEIKEIASHFPQLPMESVIIGKDENDNEVLKEFEGKETTNTLPH